MSPFKKIIIITLGSVENCLKGSGSENGEDGEEMVAVVHARRVGGQDVGGDSNKGMILNCFEMLLAFMLLNYFPSCPSVPSYITCVLNCMK